jgi:hypothetical protein
MSMNDKYYEKKYLKYKIKYLNEQIGYGQSSNELNGGIARLKIIYTK